jgi:hypothetical protein
LERWTGNRLNANAGCKQPGSTTASESASLSCKDAGGEAEPKAEEGVRGEGDDYELSGDRDSEDVRVGREEHADFEGEGHEDSPGPMAASRIADHGDVHNSKGCAVAEMIGPAEELSGGGVSRLFDGLAEDHCAEAGEYFEQVYRRDEAGEAPFFGKYERQAEDVVNNGGYESGGEAEDDGAPELAVATLAVEPADQEKGDDGRQEDEGGEDAHGAKAVEVKEEASNRRGAEEENQGAALDVPVEREVFLRANWRHEKGYVRNQKLGKLKALNAEMRQAAEHAEYGVWRSISLLGQVGSVAVTQRRTTEAEAEDGGSGGGGGVIRSGVGVLRHRC